MKRSHTSRDKIGITFYLAGMFISLIFLILTSREDLIGTINSPLEGLVLIILGGIAFILFLFSFLIGRYVPFIRYSLILFFSLLCIAGIINVVM